MQFVIALNEGNQEYHVKGSVSFKIQSYKVCFTRVNQDYTLKKIIKSSAY